MDAVFISILGTTVHSNLFMNNGKDAPPDWHMPWVPRYTVASYNSLTEPKFILERLLKAFTTTIAGTKYAFYLTELYTKGDNFDVGEALVAEAIEKIKKKTITRY